MSALIPPFRCQGRGRPRRCHRRAATLGVAGASAAPARRLPIVTKGVIHSIAASLQRAHREPHQDRQCPGLQAEERHFADQRACRAQPQQAGQAVHLLLRPRHRVSQRDLLERAGNRIVYNFPELPGLATTGGIVVHLQEQVTATQVKDFYVSSTPVVEPLYDIRVGPLVFQPGATCNVNGVSLNWRTPTGGVVRDHRALRPAMPRLTTSSAIPTPRSASTTACTTRPSPGARRTSPRR